MSDDSARIEISANSSQLDAGLRDAAAKISRWSLGVSSAVARGVGAASKAASPVLTGAAHRVGASAVDFIADQARGVKDFESDLVRLGIAGDLSREKLDAIRKSAYAASSAFGIGKEQIVKGTQAYVDLTGDIEGAAASMEMFAKIAAASGASVSDVAQASAAFRGIGVDLKDMPDVFSGLIAQGKSGAVSLKDFAGELSSLLPKWAKFNAGTTSGGLAQMGAVFQVARQGFGSASEAATGMQALMGALVQNAAKFQAAGVQIFDRDPKTGVKNLRSFEQIMASIEKSRLIKDPTLMTKALGSKEAEQTVTMLLKARQATEGQESAYRKLIAAGGDYSVLQKDLDTWLNSAPGKAEQSWERLKNKIAEVFTPERIEKFGAFLEGAVAKAEALVDALGKIPEYWDDATVEFDNPFEGTSFTDPLGITEKIMGTDDITNENADMYRTKIRDIKARSTREDKIREAFQATQAPEGLGSEGVREAGRAYLAKANAKPAELEKARTEVLQQAVKTNQQLGAMVQLLGDVVTKLDKPAPVQVSMDANKVDSAIGKSTNARRER